MILDYIRQNYPLGEPIFLSEITGYSPGYVRQEMKRLTDTGEIERFSSGVYYLPYTTILGTRGSVSFEKYIEKKFLKSGGKISGYYTGLTLANRYGFTTQNPACMEIKSNGATTAQRNVSVNGRNVTVYKPAAEINGSNVAELQFLDLMSTIDRYSEISGKELAAKLREYVKQTGVKFPTVKKYLPLYPNITYKNLYDGGLMNELV